MTASSCLFCWIRFWSQWFSWYWHCVCSPVVWLALQAAGMEQTRRQLQENPLLQYLPQQNKLLNAAKKCYSMCKFVALNKPIASIKHICHSSNHNNFDGVSMVRELSASVAHSTDSRHNRSITRSPNPTPTSNPNTQTHSNLKNQSSNAKLPKPYY